MNLLIVFDDERAADGSVLLRDERAHHLCTVLKVEPGGRVRIGQPGSGRGEAEVLSVRPGEVHLRPLELCGADESNGIELVVALPRPQSFKKVLQLAGTFGARKVAFTGAYRVEKSYFRSPVLQTAQIREQLRLGMEQGATTWLPEVTITENFRDLFPPSAAGIAPGEASLRLVAHPPAAGLQLEDGFREAAATVLTPDLSRPLREGAPATIAIGPEGGWGRKELTSFADRGFRLLSLGNRILRVETAVCALFAQLELVRAADPVR